MELLALGKPIKKPPRSDERDGELFCGTSLLSPDSYLYVGCSSCEIHTLAKTGWAIHNGGTATTYVINSSNMNNITANFTSSATYKRLYGISDGVITQLATNDITCDVSNYDYLVQHQSGNIGSASMWFTWNN